MLLNIVGSAISQLTMLKQLLFNKHLEAFTSELNYKHMRTTEYVAHLKRIDSLIRRKATGTPLELAEKLGVSKASLYRHLSDLKITYNAPLKYHKEKKCFIYDGPFDLKL